MHHYTKTLLLGLPLALLVACSNDNPSPAPAETKLKVKSVETTGSSWATREDYTYNDKDQLTAINWKRETPYETVGTEEYFYNGDQLSHIVKKISGLADEDVQFTYDQNQIIATSSFVNGKKIAYQFYEYDGEGRLVLVEFYTYNSTANGYDRNGEHRYSYYPDGNVREIQKFDFSPESAELIWNSTQAFNTYLEVNNPLQLDSKLPGIIIQRKLSSGYEMRYPTGTYPYTFSYDFRPDGYPSIRRTTYNDGSEEVSVYTYE